MKREIEVKFDMPIHIPEIDILSGIEDIASRHGLAVQPWETVRREFVYYDTTKLNYYQREETVRRVSGFDLAKSKGVYRYDYKSGTLEDRWEEVVWSNKELTLIEIAQQLTLPEKYAGITISALARTTHTRTKLTDDKTILQATIDYFDVQKGIPFRELEIELESGEEKQLHSVSHTLAHVLNLKRVHKQKYARVLESKGVVTT